MNNLSATDSAVCIAGAHRSGTSMLTRLLRACGLHLGAEADLMPARPDNPDGFWENLRFVEINDELLGELGGAWDLPPRADEDFGATHIEPLRSKAKSLIGEFDAATPWGWKDPRNSLTLPFWKSILPGLKTIAIVRNPLEVAHSMRERNGTSYSFGVRLWEIYNRRLLEATTDTTRLLTHYDQFFENAESAVQRIAAFAGLPSSDISSAAGLIATTRRHTHFTIDDLIDARVSPDVIDLYRTLLAEVDLSITSREGGSDLPITAPASAHKSTQEFIPTGTASRINDSSVERETKLRELTFHLAQRDSHIAEVSAQVRDLSTRLIQSNSEMEKARERFLQTNQLLQATSVILADAETRNARLVERLRKHLLEMKRLLRLLDQVAEAANLLRKSRRWMLANPFTSIAAKLSGRPSPGFGYLDKNVEKYLAWRTAHPEINDLDGTIAAFKSAGDVSALEDARLAKVDFKPKPPTEPIEFSPYPEIEVSIVIPVFNQIDFTQACLASLQEYSDDIPFEVIVVDDCSTDSSAEILPQIPGLAYLRNETNLGFIASCNFGAKNARGDYLLFLNNDTIVTSGWLTRLRETFDFEPEAGLVGSKLVYPDGRLQEAGGIIWRDASGWNRGKFQDPGKPEYNFLREVDYCSAASLMIPKILFESLGGFDPKYAPAYYEDTDLAFKVRAAGRKVLYQPLSRVIHYEGVTGGTDISTGTKQYQERNRAIFAETWQVVLAEKPVNGDVAAREALPAGRKRILVIDHHLPMPDRDSGSLRMSEIVRILHSLGHHVTFLPDNLADIPPYGDDLRNRGIEVAHYPYLKSAREYLKECGSNFDVVILSRCDFARKHVADVRQYAPHSRLIFDTVDLHFLRTDREARLTQDPEIREQAKEKEEAEYRLIDEADETWVVSTVERDLLAQERPGKTIHVVSNIVEVPGSASPFSLRQDFLFIGSFQHTPNIDAVLFFAQEIYPSVRQKLPEARFFIIGDKAPPSVIALADEKVIVTGLQPDVRPYFDSVKLSIAPLRYGAGVKGKINQSMGLGVPVVATSLAVEGMGLTDHEDVLIADDPAKFAAALVELYTTPALWDRISQAGVSKTKASFSREVAKRELRRLFSDDLEGASKQRPPEMPDTRRMQSFASV